MKIVFMGTPDFAVPSLKALIREGYEVAGVFTQPDRPKGRGNKMLPSPVKQAAMEAGIPVFQPVRIRRDGVEDLKALKPDLCVTAAFGQILSQEILDIPPLGNINVHASLLPKHRGAAPIAYAIMGGDKEAGVTTMFAIANKLTTAGNAIVLQYSMPIWLILLMFLFFRKKPSRLEVITIALVLIGILCFFFDSLSTGRSLFT